MELFPHVEDSQIRELLEKGWDGDEDTICNAIFKTKAAFQEDLKNEMIPEAVLQAREEAQQEASECWNEHGNGFWAVDALRDYWRV